MSAYQQSYSYDALDRLTNGPSGSETYGTFPAHGAVTLGNVPNQYASYDAMGNMTCRNVDTTSGHGCDAAQSGAIMTYDNEGRLDTWVAPNGTVASDQYLYDNSGQRVLQRASNTVGSTTTTSDTISFDGITDVTITGGTTSTTKYYSVGGQRVAMRQDGTFSYLMPDFLGSNSIALRSDGSVQAVQLFSPFGATRYSDGTMLSPFNFTGQRLDTQTGLLYYNARYYDATSGRFTSADTVETNAAGLDPFAYVKGNPETFADPTGHGRCNTDGDCTYGSGPPPPPSDPSPPPGVSGVDDACHDMSVCGSGGNPPPAPPTSTPPSTSSGGSGYSCGSGTHVQGGACVANPDHTQARNQVRNDKVAPKIYEAMGLIAAGGLALLLMDFLSFKYDIEEAEFPRAISVLIDALSILGEVANAASSVNPGFTAISSALQATVHTILTSTYGVLSTYKAVMAGAVWLKGALQLGLSFIGFTAGGLPGATLDLAAKLGKTALIYGGRALGHSLMTYGGVMLADAQHQQAMDVNDWCTQYGQGACSGV
ncbi:hypothetical protein KDK_69680 [Dictyobacter kobayashii]|uniref:Teneurin-like YD-shell domain-containing protein n=1 Tax=Dictyobacter kobayashii TaxID=2014872 RepID=A0A402AVN4_9CHLR|nr:hypothetical protein KDK_69680 [Dictyobacter kobayashii]